ncbi:MAG: FkbM family methyltransferase [Lachnospiraceae bacterium]|nr:FkbM family methyltransferase [Lachnospiraceae bacterium]
MSFFHLFPYSSVDKGSTIILAGAGEVGYCFAEQILKNKYCKIKAITDRNHKNIGCVCGIQVVSLEEAIEYQYDKIVVAVGAEKKSSVLADLEKLGIDKEKIVTGKFPCYRLTLETAEAIIIKSVFDSIGISKPSYIDVGACHPHMSSNTMLFYTNGSRGINIEPDVSLKEEFAHYRPEDVNLFVGIAAEKGTGTFYKCENPYLSSFSATAVKWSEKYWKASYVDSISVPLMTLNDVVDEYCNGTFPDFIDVDIEGMDAEVMRTLNLTASSPKVICVEGDASVFNGILMDKPCEAGGYLPYCHVTGNTIYLRKDIYKQVLKV